MLKLFLLFVLLFHCSIAVAERTFFLKEKAEVRFNWTQPTQNTDDSELLPSDISQNIFEYSVDGGANWLSVTIVPPAIEYILLTAPIGVATITARVSTCNIPLTCSDWSNEGVVNLIDPKPRPPIMNEAE